MRILVTGSEGQVGQCLIRQLTHTQWQVLGLNRKVLDISNFEQITATVDQFKPNIIINAAAYTAVDRAEDQSEQAYSVNRDGAKFLAIAANKSGAAILHISTDYVFSGNKQGTYTETDETSPQGVYGASKLAGEIAIAESCERHIILRTAWIFGENGNNFVKTMLRLGQKKKELSIVGDQIGGPTYAGDIAQTLVNFIKHYEKNHSLPWGTYHFSGLPHVSWYEFAEEIFKQALAKNLINEPPVLSEISSSEFVTNAKRPANSKLDCGKIGLNIGVKASDWSLALNNIEAYMTNDE